MATAKVKKTLDTACLPEEVCSQIHPIMVFSDVPAPALSQKLSQAEPKKAGPSQAKILA